MVKIVNCLYAAALYGAIIFALYGNEALIGDSGEGHRRNITASLAPSRGVGLYIRSDLSLTRSSATEAGMVTEIGQTPYVRGGGTGTALSGLARVKGELLIGGGNY